MGLRMKKSLQFTLLSLLLGTILIFGCKTTSVSPKLPWIERWLSSPVCQPPCWEGITPGETTAKEAHKKLSALPNVERLWLPSEYTSTHVLSWDMAGCDGSTWGSVYFEKYPDDKIEWLDLHTSCEESNITLQEMIHAFGTPQYAWAEWNSAGCKAELLNLEKGMILSTYESGLLSYRRLKPTSPVEAALLFPLVDSLEEVVESMPYLADTDIREWQVYDNPCTW